MGSPTTLWLVIFSWKKRLQPPISRSTAAPSCPHPCSCTWWSQSSPSPRSSNMSTTSSPGERSLAIELSITNWIYPKKGGTWQIGRSTHCVGLSDVSSPLLGGCHFCPVPWTELPNLISIQVSQGCPTLSLNASQLDWLYFSSQSGWLEDRMLVSKTQRSSQRGKTTFYQNRETSYV